MVIDISLWMASSNKTLQAMSIELVAQPLFASIIQATSFRRQSRRCKHSNPLFLKASPKTIGAEHSRESPRYRGKELSQDWGDWGWQYRESSPRLGDLNL